MPESAPRPRRTLRGYLLRALAVLLAGVAIAVGWQQGHDRNRGEPKPPRPMVEPTAARPKIDEQLLREALRSSLCAIQVQTPEGPQTLGTGMVVAADGTLLTCLHVMQRATEAVGVFDDGAKIEIVGYRAVIPTADIAIVRLKSSDIPRVPVTWTSDPQPQQPVAAMGYPERTQLHVVAGEVVRVVATLALPDDARAFAQRLTAGAETNRWLQHSVPLRQGFSGGPVVDHRGHVVGMNVWTDETRRVSYALPAADLQPLIATPAGELVPLERHATPAARERARQWEISAEQLLRLADQGRAMHWQPATADDYRLLQQLAVGMTIARDSQLLQAAGRTGEHVEALGNTADKLAAELRRERWRSAGKLVLLNEYAAEALSQPSAGFFACVTIVRELESAGEECLLEVKLSGFDETFLLRLPEHLVTPAAGETWMAVGLRQSRDAETAQGLRPCILCRWLWPLDKP